MEEDCGNLIIIEDRRLIQCLYVGEFSDLLNQDDQRVSKESFRQIILGDIKTPIIFRGVVPPQIFIRQSGLVSKNCVDSSYTNYLIQREDEGIKYTEWLILSPRFDYGSSK